MSLPYTILNVIGMTEERMTIYESRPQWEFSSSIKHFISLQISLVKLYTPNNIFLYQNSPVDNVQYSAL